MIEKTSLPTATRLGDAYTMTYRPSKFDGVQCKCHTDSSWMYCVGELRPRRWLCKLGAIVRDNK